MYTLEKTIRTFDFHCFSHFRFPLAIDSNLDFHSLPFLLSFCCGGSGWMLFWFPIIIMLLFAGVSPLLLLYLSLSSQLVPAAIIFRCINVNFRSNHIYHSYRYISIRLGLFLLLFFEWRADSSKIKEGKQAGKKEKEKTTRRAKKEKKNHKCRKPQFLFSVFFVFLFCSPLDSFSYLYISFFCFFFFFFFFLSRFASLFIRLLFTSCST